MARSFPSGHAHVQGNEFYAKYQGMRLRDFPDVPIKCAPFLDTSTHKLAIETDPQWIMVIRHVGSWRIKTRPKVRIYPEGVGLGKVAISFALPAAHRFETVESAFRALQDVEFRLSPHNLSLRAVQKQETKTREALIAEVWNSITEEEVFAMMDYYNLERQTKLAKRPKQRKPDTTNVVDIEDIRARVARMVAASIEDQRESDDQDAGYATSLRA